MNVKTIQIENDLRKFHAKGFVDSEIASKLRMTSFAVCYHRTKLGLKSNSAFWFKNRRFLLDTKIKKLYLKNLSDSDIAKRLGVSWNTIWLHRTKLGLKSYWVIFTEKKIQRFKKLHQKGLSDTELANRLGTSSSNISRLRKKLGLVSNGKSPAFKLKIVGKGKAKCSKCKNIFLIKKFPRNSSYCYKCHKIQNLIRVNLKVDFYLKRKFNHLKFLCKNKKIGFNITKEYLIYLYRKQKGKCFYSGVFMKWKSGKGSFPNTLSIDRIIPNKGYVYGNIVLCATRVNIIKSNLSLGELHKWIPKWYKKIEIFLKEVANERYNHS